MVRSPAPTVVHQANLTRPVSSRTPVGLATPTTQAAAVTGRCTGSGRHCMRRMPWHTTLDVRPRLLQQICKASSPLRPSWGQGPGSPLNSFLLACVWPEAFHKAMSARASEMQAYVEMARLQNVIPSFLLVLVGAWCGSSFNAAVLLNARVWLMAVISAGISVSSVIINDYFDFRSGVDSMNAPTKPLPRGVVPPDSALLLATGIYIAILIVACLLSTSLLRWIIAAAAAITLVYTPMLKQHTLVKNFAVAFVISASPMTGALACGGSSAAALAAFQTMLPATVFLFSGVCLREVLMDINDRAGDAVAGLRTLPVVVGPTAALRTAGAGVCAAVAFALSSLSSQRFLAACSERFGVQVEVLFGVTLGAFVWQTLQLLKPVLSLPRGGFDRHKVSDTISASFKPIGMGVLLLAAMS